MAYTFPTQIETRAVSLLGIDIGERGNETVQQLRTAGLNACIGLTPELLRSLSTISYERAVREFCPSDAATRFSDIDMGERWAHKGRAMVTIADELGKVVAYGWSGPEKNDVIPNAPITTAYRVGSNGSEYARTIRLASDPTFRMGFALGTLVIATAQLYGAAPQDISLETWKSNSRAITLYEALGFEHVAEKFEMKGRPTLQAPGKVINGYEVFEQTDPNDNVTSNRVFDTRCFYRYNGAAA